MRVVQGCLLGIAVFQVFLTLLGAVELLVAPQWFAPLLDDTVFADRYILATLLLGVIVGGSQWAAIAVHLRMRRWLPLGHAFARTVMTGRIAGECLVLNNFMWPHTLWDDIGIMQLLLVLVLLGVLRPGGAKVGQTDLRRRSWSCRDYDGYGRGLAFRCRGFRLSRSLTITCWLSRLRGGARGPV